MQTEQPAIILAFGRHIERMRTARELTREQFAERSGLALSTIEEIEHGAVSPPLDALRRLSRGLDIELYELFEEFERQEGA